VAEGIGEFVSQAGVGAFHNPFHGAAFGAMQGDGWAWDLSAFSGGAAQAVAGHIGRGIAGTIKTPIITVPIPVEDLLARGIGGINPAVLNDIANAGLESAGTREVAAGDGGPETAVTEPRVETLLQAAGVPPGQDTAYAIALRTGFVPTTGEPSRETRTGSPSWPVTRSP
jgi:hypothetical protein